jgi:outer membrane protein assembly factor BamB
MKALRSTVFLLLLAPPALAGDWPQWLGPHRDASTSEVVPIWKGMLKEVWRQPVGEGNSSPVVAAGKVYAHMKIKDRNAEELVAFDAGSGKEIWRKAYERAPFSSLYGSGPRATPSVIDGKLCSYGISGILTCFNASTGTILWKVDTWKELNIARSVFGTAGSPLVDGGRIYVNLGGKNGGVAAFDAAKGSLLWKNLDDPGSYTSPVLIGAGASRQLIAFTGRNVASLDPATGSSSWKFPLVDKLLESSTTPVLVGDRLLASSITYGSVALRLRDGKSGYDEAWKNPELTSYFSTPVSVEPQHVYMVTIRLPLPGRKSVAVFHCVDMQTGKVLWSKPNVGEYHASMLRTGDNKLLMLEEQGDLVLVDPNPKEYRELARAKVCDHVWAHAAVADGKLFLRDDKDLICIELPR